MSPTAASVSLPDLSVSRADMAAVRGRLWTQHARYAPFFDRHELRGHARAYLPGLLSDEPRKSIERRILPLRGADANTALVERRLYLSRDWVSGSGHATRRLTGVPAGIPFHTKRS